LNDLSQLSHEVQTRAENHENKNGFFEEKTESRLGSRMTA